MARTQTNNRQAADEAARAALDDTATFAPAGQARAKPPALRAVCELDIGVRSDVGAVRGENEDSFVVFVPAEREALAARGALLAVADGMGGHAAGAVASCRAVDALRRSYYRSLEGEVGEALERGFAEANAAVLELAAAAPERAGMGCTLVAAAFCQGELTVANVGDSRAYLLRAGELEQITEDHNVAGDLVRANVLSAEEARSTPQRTMLTRCIGFDEGVGVDLFVREVRAGDTVLLCSDGLTEELEDERIAQILADNPAPSVAAHELVDEALAQGASDNVTVVVARVRRVRRVGLLGRLLRRSVRV